MPNTKFQSAMEEPLFATGTLKIIHRLHSLSQSVGTKYILKCIRQNTDSFNLTAT